VVRILTYVPRFVGRLSLWVARATGALALVATRTLLHLPRLDRREFFRAVVHFGVRSLPLALGVAALTGAIVVLQAGAYAEKFGARQYIGWAGGYAVLWEFGPLLLGLMMAARIGARNTAELALLKVNGQIEGLRGISLDPFGLLMAPRVVATAVAVAALSTVTFLFAVLCESIASYFMLRLPVRVFFGAFADMLWWGDFAGGACKAVAFGLAISLVSTAVGLNASGGARGVGRAAATSVVMSCFTIFALDFLLTPPLARLLSS
jgi:phospholipid/cholesterol/gamma-HCH transport system permease protein